MRFRLIYPVRVLISYYLLFIVFRAAFIAFVILRQPGQDYLLALQSFYHGASLDLSAAAYLSTLPALCWSASLFWKKEFFNKAANGFHVFLKVISVLILCANIAIYAAWGTLFDYRALSFITEPEGIIASLTNTQLLLIVVVLPILIVAIVIVSLRFIRGSATFENNKRYIYIPTLFFVLFYLIRGGFQTIPINNSRAWFCEVQTMNDAASNPIWYLFDNINRNINQKNERFVFMDSQSAHARCERFKPITNRTSGLFSIHQKPNIVLIVFESWTADIIGQLGGIQGTTPVFDSICKTGLLFDSLYASGRRTDHMFPSLLSGTPALPERSLVRYNDKTAQLPMLPKALAELGYSTSFHYGGDLGFANMNSFLRKAGFQQLTGEPDFDNALHRGKWGVADGSVFNRLNRDLQHKTEPFFSMTLTLSSHEPFDVPPPYNTGRSEPERFCKAARYTDAELGSFLREASKQAWFNNTLFVFIADHGHILPKRRNYYDPNCHRIPMLWWGPALPDTLRGSRISQPGAQHDFPATLTEALGIQFTKSVFPFSGNIINRSSVPRPVYLNFETGFGWKSTNGQFVYLFSQNSYLKEYTTRTGTDSTLFEDGKAYLQTLEQYFNSL